MSKKPQKKSDIEKSWMRQRQDRKIKMQPEYHLIVTEGTKTEPEYFRAMKDIINRTYREKIHLEVCGEGDNTVHLFERARKRVRENQAVIYKHVWVVYDKDDFPDAYVNRTASLCKSESNEETIYHAVWSNQCIELWFLLHFSYFQADISRESYWPKLTECLQGIGCGMYRKNRTDMFSVLRPFMGEAIRNAQKLNEVNSGKLPANAAPGTKLYELIEKLLPYL